MKEDYRIFAKNLTLYMSHYGYNQTTLAKELSIAPATVAWWCHGERLPRFAKMVELTNLFECTQDDLFSDETSEEKIAAAAKNQQLLQYFERLNDAGIERVLQYIDDLSPKYLKEGLTS